MNNRIKTVQTKNTPFFSPLKDTPGYSKIHTGQESTAVMQIKKTYPPEQYNLFKDGNIEVTEHNVRIALEHYGDLLTGMRGSTRLLFIFLNMKYTDGNKDNGLVVAPLDEYMRVRGLKDKKSARKQVKEDLEVLKSIRFEWKKQASKKEKDFLHIYLSGGTLGIKNSNIIFRFNEDFLPVLQALKIMHIPNEILTYNTKYNPYSVSLLYKISEHKNMNLGKANENIISVKALLKACTDLPSYDEVMETSKHVRKLIIDPFERDMDEIGAFKWEYCGDKGMSIKPPETYDQFIKAKIKTTWKGYPERKVLPPKKTPPKRRKNTSKKKTGI